MLLGLFLGGLIAVWREPQYVGFVPHWPVYGFWFLWVDQLSALVPFKPLRSVLAGMALASMRIVSLAWL
jgi:hypothetical protein